MLETAWSPVLTELELLGGKPVLMGLKVGAFCLAWSRLGEGLENVFTTSFSKGKEELPPTTVLLVFENRAEEPVDLDEKSEEVSLSLLWLLLRLYRLPWLFWLF